MGTEVKCLRLKSKFRCEKTCNELNELIKDATKHVQKENNRYSASEDIIGEHGALVINHLYEKTDLQHRLNNLEVSDIFIYRSFFEIFHELKNVKENELTDRLMDLLDLKIDEVKKIKISSYKFIILLNIKQFGANSNNLTISEEYETYKSILKLFGINTVSYDDYFDRNESFNVHPRMTESELFQHVLSQYDYTNGEIIEFCVGARDTVFAIDKANKKLESFLGFISFFKHYFMSHDVSRLDEDSSIDEIQKLSFIILKNEKLNLEPYLSTWSKRKSIEDVMNKNLNLTNFIDLNITRKIHLINSLIEIITELKHDNNKKGLWESLNEFFRLYYLACSENNLTYSFLKFWTLSEYIIKKISTGKVNDDNVIRTMTKILKRRMKFAIADHLEKRIYYIYGKRNRIVHEGVLDEILSDDRILAKQITDSILGFYLESLSVLNNFGDYKFILQNINLDTKTLTRHKKLIDDLLDGKNAESN